MNRAVLFLLALGPLANAQSPTEHSKIERMVDTRDPATISGSFWTRNLDCTFKNPPPELTAKAPALSCEDTSHNVRVLKSGGDYFIPRGGLKNEPPYCLVKGPATAGNLQVSKERRYLYCHKEWSWWQTLLARAGVL